jgi:hypothetical protein
MKKLSLPLLLLLSTVFAVNAQSTVLTGSIADWAETSDYTFGDGINDFTMIWSTASVLGGNGYFYGSDSGSTYPDFYIYSGGIDVTTVSDASVFTYAGASALFNEGDTIFMRSSPGYYAALQVEEVYPNPSGNAFPSTYLNGGWYFQDDSSADFSVVPLPGTAWLFGSAMLGLMGVARRRRT